MSVTRSQHEQRPPSLPAPRDSTGGIAVRPGSDDARADVVRRASSAATRTGTTTAAPRWVTGAAVILGVATVVVATGVTLGAALTSNTPIGVLHPDASVAPAAPQAGRDGLTPNGPGVRVAIDGPAFAPPTGVAPGASLPENCPASAWRLHVAPATPQGPTAILVALTADAPSTCQGFSAPLPVVLSVPVDDQIEQVTALTATPVTVAVLATPGLSVVPRGEHAAVLPIAPLSGPQPSTYTVEVRTGARWTALCTGVSAGECLDSQDIPGGDRQYRVTAAVGMWQRSSAAVRWP